MEALRHPDNTPAALLGKPDFRKYHLSLSTREGSACGRLGGRGCSEAAEADCPTKAGRAVVGSAEVEGLRTTPPLARGVRPESSGDAMTLGHGRPPERSEEREGKRTGPGRPKDDETHPRRQPGDPGQASNKEAVSRLRLVANRSIDGLPQTRSSDLAT